MKHFCEDDLIYYYWDGDGLAKFVSPPSPTPTPPAPVEQADPSFLDLTELMPYKSSLDKESFTDDKELLDFLLTRGKSEPQESDLCPSPKKENVSDFQPTNNQDKAGSSCVPRFTANVNPLNHWSTFNRPELHTGAAPSTSATNNVASRKLDETEGKPYTKKPLNAFMLFKAEQRQNVADELQITNSAKVNVELGKRWKMMSEQEKKPYFDQAHREKKAHELKYPGWSYKDSYGKKPKRTRADKIQVPLNHHHHVASPVAPANQRPGMMWNATAPMSFSNQTLNNQAHSYHTSHSQNNQKTTIILNGIPVQATPIGGCLGDSCHSSHLERRRSC